MHLSFFKKIALTSNFRRIFLCVALVGIFFFGGVVSFSRIFTPAISFDGFRAGMGGALVNNDNVFTFTGGVPKALASLPPTPAPTPNGQEADKKASLDCGTTIFTFSLNCFIASIANFFMWMMSVFLYFGGHALNWMIKTTVIEMGSGVNGMTGIVAAWSVLRDIGNLIFIFALVAIGLATILQISSYGWKNLLKSVIIGALLINFSMTIAKVVIDTSNLIATEVYRQIIVTPECSRTTFTDAAERDRCENVGLSGRFMDEMYLTGLHSMVYKDLGGGEKVADNMMKIILVGFLGSIFLLVTAFIFFAAAILFAVRYVVLILLIIFSPIAFAGIALPQFKKYVSEWWHALFSQAFFAPAYLLMMYITLKILETDPIMGMVQGGEKASFAAALIGTQGTMGIVINYIVVTGFMILSLIVASKMGAWGSDIIMKKGKGFATGIAGGALAYTAGLGSKYLKKGYDSAAASKFGEGIRSGNKLLNTKVGIAGRSIAAVGTLGLSEGVIRGARTVAHTSIPNTLAAGKSNKWLGTASLSDREKVDTARTVEVETVKRDQTHTAAIKAMTSAEGVVRATELQEKERRGENLSDDEKKDLATHNQHYAVLRSMSGADIVAKIKDHTLSGKTLENAMAHLTPEQTLAITSAKPEDVSDETKATAQRSRYAPISTLAHQAQETRITNSINAENAEISREKAALATITNPAARAVAETALRGREARRDVLVQERETHKERVKNMSKEELELSEVAAMNNEEARIERLTDPAQRAVAEADLKKRKDSFGESLKNYSPSEVEHIFVSGHFSEAQMRNLAPHLSSDQLSAIKKSTKINPAVATAIGEAKYAGLQRLANGTSTTEFAKALGKLKPDELPNLPKGLIKASFDNPVKIDELTKTLSTQHIAKITTEDMLSAEQRKRFYDAVDQNSTQRQSPPQYMTPPTLIPANENAKKLKEYFDKNNNVGPMWRPARP